MKTGRRRAGFTLVELIVVIAIIGVLATMVIVRYVGKTDQAKVSSAKAQISQLEGAILDFQASNGRLPNTLSELVERPSDAKDWPDGGYLKGKTAPKDPWGHDYVYRSSTRRFEIISLGADGKEGGESVDADIVSSN